MEQTLDKLTSLLQKYSKGGQKPSQELKECVKTLKSVDTTLLLQELTEQFDAFTQGGKIHQVLRILVWKSNFPKEQDETSKKQFTEFLFHTFGIGLNKNMVVDARDLRVRRVMSLKALSSDQLFESFLLGSMQKDSKYLTLGLQCIDFKKANDSIKKLLLDQLKEELLIDTKNKLPNALQFHEAFYTTGLLNDGDVIALLETAEKLLKRSENNVDTLLNLLQILSSTKLDLSAHIQVLIDSLTDLVATHSFDRALKCLQIAGGHVQNEKVLIQLIDYSGKGINSTNDEIKKHAFINLLSGVVKSLANIKDVKAKSEVQDATLALLSSAIAMFTKDEQFTPIIAIIDTLYKNGSTTYKLPSNQIATLKKLAGQSKYTASYVNIIMLNHIKLRKSAVSEEKQFNELAEVVFNFSVVQNLKKGFPKTVSQPIMFFSGLSFVLLYFHYCQDDAPAKLVTAINKEIQALDIFNMKSHFSQLKYLIQMERPESQYLGETLLLLYATFQEEFQDFSLDTKFEYFSTLFNLISFSAKTDNNFNFKSFQPYFNDVLSKSDDGQTSFIIDMFSTLRWYVYTINPYQREELHFNKDRLNEFIRNLLSILVKALIADNEYLTSIPYIDDIFLTITHPFTSKTWITYVQKYLTKFNLCEVILGRLLKFSSGSPHLWISEYGVESTNRFTPEGIQNYTLFLVNLGAKQEMVSALVPIFSAKNLNDIYSLDVVNQEYKKFMTNFRSKEDPHVEDILQQVGCDTFTNVAALDEEEEAIRSQVAKGKKGENLQMMNENEAAEQSIKAHKTRFINYFSAMCKYLKAFYETDDVASREWFFVTYNESLMSLCQYPGNRMPYTKLVAPYLRLNALTQKFTNTIIATNIQRSIGQAHFDKIELQHLLSLQQMLATTAEIKSVSTLHFVHELMQYILLKNDFELKHKQLAMKFVLHYSKISEYFATNLLNQYYNILIENINICAHVSESFDLITLILQNNDKKKDQYLMMFEDILNLVEEAKVLVLKCLQTVDPVTLPIDLSLAVKLRVLKLDGSDKVVVLAEELIQTLPSFDKYLPALEQFDFKGFVSKNAREHLEYTTQIFADNVKDVKDWSSLCTKVFSAAKELESKLEEEQLLFFPNFVLVCVEHIPQDQCSIVIDLFIGRFASEESRQALVQKTIQAGVALIKKFGAQGHQNILPVIERYMKTNTQVSQKKEEAPVVGKKGAPAQVQVQTKNQNQKQAPQVVKVEEVKISMSSSICAIIYLGVLSPYLKSSKEQLMSIQQQILKLFNNSPRATQVNLAKCLGDLLAFFPDAEQTIKDNIQSNKQELNPDIKRGHSFLVAGLIKGMGIHKLEELRIIETISETSGGKKETIDEKQANLFQLEAIVEILGRLAEPYYVQILHVLMKYFGDGKDEIRQISINATRIIMLRLTGYGVKIILPYLFRGIEESSAWRGKIANIWALGNMAYCSPKQLSFNLPNIVSSISKAISDTHPMVRQSANESLELIGSTIQNPEISGIADVLIKSLSNPFDDNLKGLEILLSTNFAHYIDAPALSLLIPIIDYGLRSQDSLQKQQAARVVGCIPVLIKHAEDLVPYMCMLVGGLEVALGDPLIEVRALAAKAIGRLSHKVGIAHTENFFKFVWDILETPEVAALKRSGAANSLAEIICTQGIDYFETQLNMIFQKAQSPDSYIKEGYVGTFIYIPGIMDSDFEPYVKDVIDNIQELVSHDDDTVRSISLRVLKILIQNYAVVQNELLYPTLNEAMRNIYWKRRNAAVILSGEMLEITQKVVKKQMESPQNPQYIHIELYVQNLMLLYILRQDDAEQVRQNATQIWKGYIDNTPRWVKRGLRSLVWLLSDIMTRPGLHIIGVNTIQNFCQKYGESHLNEVLSHLEVILVEEKKNLSLITGVYSMLTQLYRFSDYDVLIRYSDRLRDLSTQFILSKEHTVKKQLFLSVGMMITKLKSTTFVEDLIQPFLETLSNMPEEHPEYQIHLEIFDELCNLNSSLILAFLIVLILDAPLDQYKIDILTNNARTFSKVIYNKSNGQVPITVLFRELYGNTGEYKMDANGIIQWPNRTQSLIYCIGQLSIHLNREVEDFVSDFLRDVQQQVDNYSKYILMEQPTFYNELVIALEVLQYFLHNTSEEYFTHSANIIPKATPYLFLQNPSLSEKQTAVLREFANKILIDINNTDDSDKHHGNLSIVHTCFFNKINATNFNSTIYGLQQDEAAGIKPYVEMLINSIVYGGEETFGQAIDIISILIKYSSVQNMQVYILKIVGALIRVLNYRINVVQKVQALQIINQANLKQLQLGQFCSQINVSYFKLIVPINEHPDGLKVLAQNYAKLFIDDPKRDLHLNELFQKVLLSQTDEQRECHLKIIKNAIKENSIIFSKALLERLFTMARQLFERLNSGASSQSHESNLIGDIQSLIYGYASNASQINYQEKYLTNLKVDQSPQVTFLFTAFFRRHKAVQDQGEKLKEIMFAVLKDENNDTFTINQTLKNLGKLKKQGLAPFTKIVDYNSLVPFKMYEESSLLLTTLTKLKA